jgi:hypothetical protein
MPTGKLGGQEFSRLMMGGNLIGGWSHSRELAYVSTLARRYNTEAKIRETLELGESQGITAINTWVMQENAQLFNHWKCGGKMKWVAQVRLDADGGYSQIQRLLMKGPQVFISQATLPSPCSPRVSLIKWARPCS